ncbi:MAG: Adenosylcobinamide kinase (EC 2.7.1.156) / Adenosylcobinamide-phosphate guanylyltransferase (EC 2.7.7.62) [Olavius algarvensis Delta 4 endosymbiont]|nr:MAG: Adenosylcobinamide kinase (EC 2.7.1.156) / Adenosylcobinamide-phosphate guanylyltransferase (EC 2.7.7.62) [Olavius algarvensis Delta 4 endosymbiont]
MSQITFVIGGCRSGKSGHAQVLGEEIQGKKLYLATCEPHDEEMQARVRLHRQQRGDQWETLEEPVEIAAAIADPSGDYSVILVDCLTLWTSNLLLSSDKAPAVDAACRALVQSLKSARCPVILVSNEVGTGIVPDNELARRYRDEAGWVNQKIAAAADRVVWMVAGIPVTIKGK